jgi:hypothetical protein
MNEINMFLFCFRMSEEINYFFLEMKRTKVRGIKIVARKPKKNKTDNKIKDIKESSSSSLSLSSSSLSTSSSSSELSLSSTLSPTLPVPPKASIPKTIVAKWVQNDGGCKATLVLENCHVSLANAIRRTALSHGTSWRSRCTINKLSSVTSALQFKELLQLLPVYVPNWLIKEMKTRALATAPKCYSCMIWTQYCPRLFPPLEAVDFNSESKTLCENCSVEFHLDVKHDPSNIETVITTDQIKWKPPSWHTKTTEAETIDIPHVSTKKGYITTLTYGNYVDLTLRAVQGSQLSHNHCMFIPATQISCVPLVKIQVLNQETWSPSQIKEVRNACPKRCFGSFVPELEEVKKFEINTTNCVCLTDCQLKIEEVGQAKNVIRKKVHNQHRLMFKTISFMKAQDVIAEDISILLQMLGCYRNSLNILRTETETETDR